MKRKILQVIYYAVIACLVLTSCSFVYYISVNTYLSDTSLPNVRLGDLSFSFKEKGEIESELNAIEGGFIPERITYSIDSKEYEVLSRDLDIQYDADEIVGYGKGASFSKVLSEGLNLLGGANAEFALEVNVAPIISEYLGDYTISPGYIYVDGLKTQCDSQILRAYFDEEKITRLVTSLLLDGEKFSVELKDTLKDSSQEKFFRGCKKYGDDYAVILNAFSQTGMGVSPEIFLFSYVEGRANWTIANREQLALLLEGYKGRADVGVGEGEYETIDGKILLLRSYQEGRSVNVEKSIEEIRIWLNNLNNTVPVYFDTLTPKVLLSGKEILDFTKQLAEGTTRIDLVRNGAPNIFVEYAQAGVEEMHNRIVDPGAEFSFINAINPNRDMWLTAKGRVIGAGYCNSTTTLFRAALESGFPITDRSYHYHYVPSYEWGYPENIVDAAFLLNPDIDMKFVNDLAYPILLRVEFRDGGDGYQYHTIKVLTSSQQMARVVQLVNFRKWNILSNFIFEGAFDRVVWEGDKIIREDSFYSRYL